MLKQVQLGTTGMRVSEIALGTWRFGDSRSDVPDLRREEAHDLLDEYRALGGTFIDTADRYGDGKSESWIGDWLRDHDRDEFVIASKLGRPTLDREDLSRKFVRNQIERMLDRLGTDYLDILYAHRWDDGTPVREFMRTFSGLVDDGRVHYVGISTRSPNAWKVVRANELAHREGLEPFTVTQPRYNLVKREIEGGYLEMCREYGLGVVPYNPLGEGFLTGKYDRTAPPPAGSRAASEDAVVDRYFSDATFDLLELVDSIAAAIDATPAQVSLAWLLRHPDVTAPITGARTVDQLRENVGSTDVELTDDQYDALSDAIEP